jgi:predicted ABC-type sugar transport system permease subunit
MTALLLQAVELYDSFTIAGSMTAAAWDGTEISRHSPTWRKVDVAGCGHFLFVKPSLTIVIVMESVFSFLSAHFFLPFNLSVCMYGRPFRLSLCSFLTFVSVSALVIHLFTDTRLDFVLVAGFFCVRPCCLFLCSSHC